MKKFALLFTFGCLSTINFMVFAQNQSKLSEEAKKRVDQLFEEWNPNNAPGISFAILLNGEIIYERNHGLADIENRVPITSKTQFNLGQLSTHFTSYALLKLIAEEKLDLKEDASQYIEALNKFDEVITIRDLLFGASGIYDYRILKSICGWQPTDDFSKKDMLALVLNQEKTAYIPGTEYSNSATNFFLIAELIEKVAGTSFKNYLEKEIFEPLGMTNTVVAKSTANLKRDIAYAYRTTDKGIIRDHSANSIQGINNIFSCLDDLIIWEKHLADTDIKIIEWMDSPIKLENGRTNSTSYGELTLGQLYGHKERGLYSTYITGSNGGYDASIFRFPSQQFTAIALSNNGIGYNGYFGVIAAHHIIPKAFTEPETTDFKKIKTESLSNTQLKLFEGYYWDQLGELSRAIKIKNDTLRYVRSNGSESALIPLSENTFQMQVPFDDKIYIQFPKENSNTMVYQYEGAEPIYFEKYIPLKYKEKELSALFNGFYLNKQYNIVFKGEAKNNTFILHNTKTGEIRYTPIKPTLFQGDQWFMQSIEFTRDKEQHIDGFYVKNSAIRNLWFKRLEQ